MHDIDCLWLHTICQRNPTRLQPLTKSLGNSTVPLLLSQNHSAGFCILPITVTCFEFEVTKYQVTSELWCQLLSQTSVLLSIIYYQSFMPSLFTVYTSFVASADLVATVCLLLLLFVITVSASASLCNVKGEGWLCCHCVFTILYTHPWYSFSGSAIYHKSHDGSCMLTYHMLTSSW